MHEDDLLTTGDLARLCGVSKGTVHYWMLSGKLPKAIQAGPLRVWQRHDVEHLIEIGRERKVTAQDVVKT